MERAKCRCQKQAYGESSSTPVGHCEGINIETTKANEVHILLCKIKKTIKLFANLYMKFSMHVTNIKIFCSLNICEAKKIIKYMIRACYTMTIECLSLEKGNFKNRPEILRFRKLKWLKDKLLRNSECALYI